VPKHDTKSQLFLKNLPIDPEYSLTILDHMHHTDRNSLGMPIALWLALLITCIGESPAQQVRMPAEWEPQERVFLSWFGAIRRDTVTCRIIEALQPHVSITLHIWDDSIRHIVNKRLSGYAIDTSAIHMQVDPDAMFWTRDPVVFVKADDQPTVVCYAWTEFGVYPDLLPGPLPAYAKVTGEYDERLAALLQLPVIQSDFVFEGGGIESNGNGTILMIRDMALQRNPTKTIAQIEAELKRTIGAKKVIWLQTGLVEDKQYKDRGPFFKNYFGGGANMHIDELCRFVNETTVVIPYIREEEKNHNPIDSMNYDMLEANYKLLQQATTWDGKPLTVVRLPMPEIMPLIFTMQVDSNNYSQMQLHGFDVGDTIYRVPAASYCNFFISNEVVLTQKYWKPGMSESQRQKDEESRKILESLFPGRKVVPVFTHSINRGGGGIHCMTHELPMRSD
jgi:agmatine deiminase